MSHQKYLFDTNLFIERFRRTPKVVRLFGALHDSQITLSVVSYLEFVRGEVLGCVDIYRNQSMIEANCTNAKKFLAV